MPCRIGELTLPTLSIYVVVGPEDIGKRRFGTATLRRFDTPAGNSPLLKRRRVFVLQFFDQIRRVALLQGEIAHAVRLATEDFGETFIEARRADDARIAVAQ